MSVSLELARYKWRKEAIWKKKWSRRWRWQGVLFSVPHARTAVQGLWPLINLFTAAPGLGSVQNAIEHDPCQVLALGARVRDWCPGRASRVLAVPRVFLNERVACCNPPTAEKRRADEEVAAAARSPPEMPMHCTP